MSVWLVSGGGLSVQCESQRAVIWWVDVMLDKGYVPTVKEIEHEQAN